MVNKFPVDKENVPLALAVIHETAIANILEMFNTCWIISNSKKRFSPIYWKCCDQWG